MKLNKEAIQVLAIYAVSAIINIVGGFIVASDMNEILDELRDQGNVVQEFSPISPTLIIGIIVYGLIIFFINKKSVKAAWTLFVLSILSILGGIMSITSLTAINAIIDDSIFSQDLVDLFNNVSNTLTIFGILSIIPLIALCVISFRAAKKFSAEKKAEVAKDTK